MGLKGMSRGSENTRCGGSGQAGEITDFFAIISVFRIVAISKAHLKFSREHLSNTSNSVNIQRNKKDPL
jgi:hypothetical protein